MGIVFRPLGRLLGAIHNFPPVLYDVHMTRRVPITMLDGVTIMATLFTPCPPPHSGRIESYSDYPQDLKPDGSHPPQPHPTVLIQTPYNRKIFDGAAELFAERGFYVLTVDLRGRCESEGVEDPFMKEESDGGEIIKWLHDQPWFQQCPKVGGWGPSYMGIVQYASMQTSGHTLDSMVPMMCTSTLLPAVMPDGILQHSLLIRWVFITRQINNKTTLNDLNRVNGSMDKHTKDMMTSPLKEVEARMAGDSKFMQAVLQAATDPTCSYWHKIDWSHKLPSAPPVHLVGGWMDIFLRDILRDYRAMSEACKEEGRCVRLTVGPWTHFDDDGLFTGASIAMWQFEEVLKGKEGASWHRSKPEHRGKPVSLFIMGSNKWKHYDTYPPPCTPTPLYLCSNRSLGLEPGDNGSSKYHYDPNDPTPHNGGPEFHPTKAGMHDQAMVESRKDVLVFTSPELVYDVEIVGPITLEVLFQSSLQHTDLVGRLCYINPGPFKKSRNICEGNIRLTPTSWGTDGSPTTVRVDMWATAFHFRKGMRIRLQVCSGAHPRLMRNFGTGEILDQSKMLAADQEIFHGLDHPAKLLLPVTEGQLQFHIPKG